MVFERSSGPPARYNAFASSRPSPRPSSAIGMGRPTPTPTSSSRPGGNAIGGGRAPLPRSEPPARQTTPSRGTPATAPRAPPRTPPPAPPRSAQGLTRGSAIGSTTSAQRRAPLPPGPPPSRLNAPTPGSTGRPAGSSIAQPTPKVKGGPSSKARPPLQPPAAPKAKATPKQRAPNYSQVAAFKAWRVVTIAPTHAIREEASKTSARVDSIRSGSTVHGTREGDWLRLSDDSGYCLIRDGAKVFVEEIGDEAHGEAEDAEVPQTPPFEDEQPDEQPDEEQPLEPELEEEAEYPEEWADEQNDEPNAEVLTPNGEDEDLEGELEAELEPEAEGEDDVAMEDEGEYPGDEAVDEGELEFVDNGMEEEIAEDAVEEEPAEDLPAEPEEEFQLAAHWGLLDAVDEEDNFYEEPLPEDEESEHEEEEAAAKEDNLRAEDMRLDEVPEHLRDAVEGSERIKKMLEAEDDGPPAKRRKLGDDEEEEFTLKRESHPEKRRLLRELRVEDNSACRYVVEVSPLEEVQKVIRSKFEFRETHKTIGEQLNDQFIRVKEREMVHGSKVDSCAAFAHRFKLKEEEDRMLRKLSHKELRYVIANYNETQALNDIIEEAKAAEPASGPAGGAAAKPGLLTLGRFNRLELISPFDKALVVGDANLTFSLLLAQHRADLGHTGRSVVTTFEQLPTLKERYQEIEETIQKLTDLGAEVLHNVDCTRLGVDRRFEDKKGQFGAVYYNFPHAGAVRGFFDGHPFVRWRHENLMHLFFRALTNFVKVGGSVKVASNQRAQGVRFSDIISAAESNEFVHVETVPFTEWTLRSYNRSYGDKRDETRRLKDGEVYNAQKVNSDMVYCFTYCPSGEALEKPRVRYPPTKKDLMQATEGPLMKLSGDRKAKKVEELTQLFLSYVQGIHVG